MGGTAGGYLSAAHHHDGQPPEHHDRTGLFRIRIGAWRLIYRKQVDNAIEVVRVRNRKEAYR